MAYYHISVNPSV